jgi:16S rRNA C1402 N4-methylase RsmH
MVDALEAKADAYMEMMDANAKELDRLMAERRLNGLQSISRKRPDGRVVTVSFHTVEDAIAFEQYAIEAASGMKENT